MEENLEMLGISDPVPHEATWKVLDAKSTNGLSA